MSLGLKRENILVSDAKGVVYMGRTDGMDPNKERYARDTSARTLAESRPCRSTAIAPHWFNSQPMMGNPRSDALAINTVFGYGSSTISAGTSSRLA